MEGPYFRCRRDRQSNLASVGSHQGPWRKQSKTSRLPPSPYRPSREATSHVLAHYIKSSSVTITTLCSMHCFFSVLYGQRAVWFQTFSLDGFFDECDFNFFGFENTQNFAIGGPESLREIKNMIHRAGKQQSGRCARQWCGTFILVNHWKFLKLDWYQIPDT